MSAHTPGPWRVDEMGLQVRALEMQMLVADIRGWGYLTGQGTSALALSPEKAEAIQRANAAIIAAAPDLLAALKRLLGRHACAGINLGFEGCGACEEARAAIEKAEGNR